eukprot:TRINITY_DN5101_c1_g1_i2.p2 TRINITY_DN5101_c1_g1~~TRINITY_DN5101_c1_g1_i2.p2  ORF type:complete len:211 (+),score=93.94 TRINITY_DN5101_c1_g1_i2:77-709(+)
MERDQVRLRRLRDEMNLLEAGIQGTPKEAGAVAEMYKRMSSALSEIAALSSQADQPQDDESESTDNDEAQQIADMETDHQEWMARRQREHDAAKKKELARLTTRFEEKRQGLVEDIKELQKRLQVRTRKVRSLLAGNVSELCPTTLRRAKRAIEDDDDDDEDAGGDGDAEDDLSVSDDSGHKGIRVLSQAQAAKLSQQSRCRKRARTEEN